jgi:Zeta toxin
MSTERVFHLDVSAEVDRLFNDSSIPADQRPNAVIIMGTPAAGKTTIRKQKYASGYVLIDAADIFLSLSRGEYFPFPEAFQETMDLIGRLVADRALSERRNIVTEIIGAEKEPTRQLIEAIKSIDYAVHLDLITCDDIQEAMRRNMSRGDDDISAYYAEPFQRNWIIDACNKLANNRKV